MATATQLLTFADFEALPERRDRRQELHHGVLVEMPPAKLRHTQLQARLLNLLNAAVTGATVFTEFPFRPKAEHECWYADIAVIAPGRLESATGDYFTGVPDIVIEVLSPSNTASEMLDRERMCLENGGREFWLVDPDSRTLRITTAEGRSRIVHAGESVSLAVLGAGELPTANLFD